MMIKKVFLLATIITMIVSLEGVIQLTDSNFEEIVKKDTSIWLVLFSAQWCGHCKEIKPEIEKLAPRLQKFGIKVGHVDEKDNRKLVEEYVVDEHTHMVRYPTLKVFLGSEVLTQVPGGLTNAEQMYYWFVKEYSLQESNQEEL